MSFWKKLFGDRNAQPSAQRTSPEITSDRVLVSNLSFDATESDISKLFNGSGVVKSVEVVVDKYTQRSKGFAFVTMMSIEDAKKAVADLHNKEFMGRPLAVSGVKPNEKPQPQQPATAPAPQPAISQVPASPTSEASIHDRLMRMFGSHFQRMRAELQHRPTIEILTEVESRFHENASAISAMVEETLSDRKLHTKCIGGGGTRVWLLVSVVPRDRHNSASFFGREYPPGYAGYMQFWLDSQPFKMAQRIGNDIFAHVLLYADASASEPLSLGFGLFPLDQTRPDSTPKVIMPQESLTREDKAAMGL